ARSIDSNLIDGFCVANLEEAIELLPFNKNVLILGALIETEIQTAIEKGIVISIIDLHSAIVIDRIAASINMIAKCQIKIDTGMGRLGLLPNEAVGIVTKINSFKNISLVGVFSH